MAKNKSRSKLSCVSFECSEYKVVEISTVTNETIEASMNKTVAEGWIFDQIQFVVRDSSRRPCMAFLFFTRPVKTETSPTTAKTRECGN